MGKNTPLGFHPEIEPTQVHDKKSEKRAKVHQRGDGFNLAQITEQQGDSADKLMPDRVKRAYCCEAGRDIFSVRINLLSGIVIARQSGI